MEKLVHFATSDLKTKEPAFCVKSHIQNGDTKFFINFCHSTSISPPTLMLSEADLKQLIENENYDELSKFSIPIVLEELQTTTDKKGNSAKVTHAIMNSDFYHANISPSDIFKQFIIYVTIEIINEKFNTKLDQTSCVILKNKHFQLADGKSTFVKLITPYVPIKNAPIIEDISLGLSEENSNDENYDQNVRINLDLKLDIVEIGIKFSDEIDYNDLILLLNEDRIVVKNCDKVLHDFFLSVQMKSSQATASFKNNILRIKCPVNL